MNSVIIKDLIKILTFIILGIIFRLLYNKYYYRKKFKKEIEEVINTPGEIKIISFNTPKTIHGTQHDYIGFFYDWPEFKRYINNHDSEKYLNKIFSIEMNHKIHYYLIVSDCVVEEISLSNDN